MSAQKNKNLQKAKNKRTVYMFFATFFFSMFIVGFVIKALSPKVDVEIGDDVQSSQETATDEQTPAAGVDNRLKWIQFEDNMPGASKKFVDSSTTQATGTDASVKSLDQKINEFRNGDKADMQQSQMQTQQQQMASQTQKTQRYSAPKPSSAEVARSVNNSSHSSTRPTKVYIGYYTSVDQAISVQNKLIDSDLNASPFVKEVNGYYVVQVGSYSNRAKAQSLYSQVSGMGLPAKMVSD